MCIIINYAFSFFKTGEKFLQVNSIELSPSTKNFESAGSLFGIVGWDDTNFYYVVDAEFPSDLVEGKQCLRSSNPWIQLLHDHEIFLSILRKCMTEICDEVVKNDEDLAEDVNTVLENIDGVNCSSIFSVLDQIMGPEGIQAYRDAYPASEVILKPIIKLLSEARSRLCRIKMIIAIYIYPTLPCRFKLEVLGSQVHIFFAFFRGVKKKGALAMNPFKKIEYHGDGSDANKIVDRAPKVFASSFSWAEVARYMKV